MGWDIEFVRISQKELEQLRSGDIDIDTLTPSRLGLPKDKTTGQPEPIALVAFKYVCSKYQFSDWPTLVNSLDKSSRAIVTKLSEKDLQKEAAKLGLHYWFDTTRMWNELHILLTGKSIFPGYESLKKANNIFTTVFLGGKSLDADNETFGAEGECYLTLDQVQEIAEKLRSVDYERLSKENKVDTGVDEDAMEECFAGFKNFFLDAHEQQQSVVRQSG